jgi:hypothetical protein
MASSPIDAPIHISTSNKWLIVDKSNWKSPRIDISIKKADGTALVNEKIKVSKKYNLKNVPDGNYALEIEDDQLIRIQSLQISGDRLFSTGVKTIYKPMILFKTNQIDMNMMTQGDPAWITIRDRESNTVFTEKITQEVSVSRRFNLDQLPEGQYILDVELSGKHFTHNFSK